MQGYSPKTMMYIVVFTIPTITIIATDIAMYFKVRVSFTIALWTTILGLWFISTSFQMKEMQEDSKRLSIRKEDERRAEKVSRF